MARKKKTRHARKPASSTRALAASHEMLIVKRKGHAEKFDEKKLYASIYYSCMNAHMNEEEAEGTAASICKLIKACLRSRARVDSNELFRLVTAELSKRSKDAGFMYSTHMDLS